ncbi:MAG TPA: DUF4112 domain-containing protein [Pyrinomonadaceae bacterium]|nr:DUF4112 domain-containing protein [Pyrinomonadaceae bacterium]
MERALDLRKRATPATSIERAAEIEESLDQISRWMDGLFRIPGVGWRFGLDAIVGLIPGVGDTATTLVSFYILAAAVRYRVPKITLLRMGLNIGIDYLVGSVPVVGDIFDAFWKSNQMNVELLRKRATVSKDEARQGRVGDWLFLGFIIILLLALLFSSIALTFMIVRFVAGHISSPF